MNIAAELAWIAKLQKRQNEPDILPVLEGNPSTANALPLPLLQAKLKGVGMNISWYGFLETSALFFPIIMVVACHSGGSGLVDSSTDRAEDTIVFVDARVSDTIVEYSDSSVADGRVLPVDSRIDAPSPSDTMDPCSACGAHQKCVGNVCVDRGLAMSIAGTPELVWDHSAATTDPCILSDGPAHMWRDTTGRAHMILAGPSSYRVSSVTTDGQFNANVSSAPTMVFSSPQDTLESAYNSRFWLMGFWTDDGMNISAVAHHEWYHPSVYVLLPPPHSCSADGTNMFGWVNTIHHLTSIDGGASFAPTVATLDSSRLVVVPEPYCPVGSCTGPFTAKPVYPDGEVRYGFFHPSNIVKEGNWYYLVAGSQELVRDLTTGNFVVPYRSGFVLLRTNDISTTWTSGSWQHWNGTGWSALGLLKNGEAHLFVDRADYPQPRTVLSFVQESHREHLFGLTWSLTFNTVAQHWVLLGYTGADQWVSFTTTKTLDAPQFTPVERLAGSNQVSNITHWWTAYPTLVDPASQGKVFMFSGDAPYLYYSVSNSNFDRDVYRLPVAVTLKP